MRFSLIRATFRHGKKGNSRSITSKPSSTWQHGEITVHQVYISVVKPFLEELGFIAHEDWDMTLQSPVRFSFVTSISKSSRLLRFPLGVCIPFFRHYHNILSRQKKIRSLVWGILGQTWAWVLLGFGFSLL